MLFGTSCFNTVYRKNLTRFWPLWAVYTLIWGFAMPLSLLQTWLNRLRWGNSPYYIQQALTEFTQKIPSLLTVGVFLAAVFGVFCAMAVFGYLCTTRSVCMMQALPMRRRELFAAQYLGGLSMLILPNLAVAAVTAILELCLIPSADWGTVLPALGVWLAVQSGLCLFFFSFAAFCAMFTGSVLALPVFYGILNFLAAGINLLLRGLMAEFFYGFSGWSGDMTALVEWLTPFVKLFDACAWRRAFASQQYCLSDPGVVAVYAAAGAVLAVLAALVYQTRHAESAGDVVAIPVVRPVFRCGVSFCTGLAMGVFTAAFFGTFSNGVTLTILVLLWTVVGWFVAEMFLRRSFRVWKAWKGCVVMMAAVALLCLGCMFDLFGVQNRIPALDRIESVTVDGNSVMGYPSDGASRNQITLTDPARIEKVTALHRAILDWHNAGEDRANTGKNTSESISMYVTYHLKGGSTMTRSYYFVSLYEEDVEQPGTVTYAMDQLINDRDIVAAAYGFDQYDLSQWIADAWEGGTYHADRDHNIRAYLDGIRDMNGGYGSQSLDGAAAEDLDGLWKAVLADFKAGTLGRRYLFDYSDERLDNTCRTDLVFDFEVKDKDSRNSRYQESVIITLTPNAENTLRWLRENSGLGSEYTIPTYRQWQEGNYDDTAGEEVTAIIGGIDGPTAALAR